jgi:diguanylate cyclase (GGDEF)-like protein
MAATAVGDQDRIVVLIDLMKVIQQSLLESVDEGVSITLSATTDEGAKSLFSLESGDVAEDAIFDSSIDLLNNTLLTLNFAASESYLSDKMNYTSVMFLITGLLLSYLMGSYLKRIGQHLKTLREEQEVLADQMIDTSWHDPLTGLVNRIHFDEALDVECRRAVREFSPLTMILLRIDGFKPYTDHYGIDAADILLQRVFETSKSSVGRPGDMIARLDDHQFGFILPSTNELVVQLAERCTLSIRELEIPNESEAENGVVTLSIGVATLQPTRLLTADRLFEVANEQLLIAIDKGGDQYSAYAESGLEPSVTYSV